MENKRGLLEGMWCSVKHLLCAEEHLIEATQKIIRNARKEKSSELWKLAFELLEICDVIRGLRQKIVQVTLEVERSDRLEKGS